MLKIADESINIDQPLEPKDLQLFVKDTILVVDDTQSDLRLLAGILVEQGYKVRPVSSSHLALSAAQTDPPDLILLDIQMSDMDGYEICERLKADRRTWDIPVIFINTSREPAGRIRAFSKGGVDYITKPFQVEEILARIETHLKLRHLEKQLEEQTLQLMRQIAERNRVEAALQKVSEEVEQRIQERTTELTKLNAAYERFVPRGVLSFLDKQSVTDVRLGDQIQQVMTVLYSNIHAFTTLSETMTPQENFDFINTYLSYIGPVIRHNRGIIDKYIGDTVIALFPEQAEDALKTAIAILGEVTDYNAYRQTQGCPPIRMGIGLHTGDLMLGIIGEDLRLEGTIISDTINTVSRIEDLTKQYGAAIVVSEHTLLSLDYPTRYNFRFLDKIRVKGQENSISIFEILEGLPQEVMALKMKTQIDFEKGILHYHRREFIAARQYFRRVVACHPQDQAAVLYLQRTENFITYGTSIDWEEIEILATQCH